MSFFDQFSKVTKDFGSKAQEITKDIKGKLEEQQAISKLNSQISEANNLIKNTYTAIGETYYRLHKDDLQCDMAEQFAIIAGAMEKIEQCRQQIKEIKNENTCPNCGAVISKEAAFCPSCGTKIEKQPKNEQEEICQKLCPVCGQPIEEDDMFCTSCGAPVTEKEDPAEETQEAESSCGKESSSSEEKSLDDPSQE